MIRSFRDKGSEALFNREPVRWLPPHLFGRAVTKLWMIHYAGSMLDLKHPPANRLELLKGSRQGQFSIRINDQWRICFFWRDNDAYEVEVTDYH